MTEASDAPADPRARELIATLNLRPLPGESGYFADLGRSALTVIQDGRTLAVQSRIFYLLTRERPVNYLHWLASEDTHVLLEGGPVDYFLFGPEGGVATATLTGDAAKGRRILSLPAGSGKALRLHADAGYALLLNVLSPEWTEDRVRVGADREFLDRYTGAASWATEERLRDLIGPNFR